MDIDLAFIPINYGDDTNAIIGAHREGATPVPIPNTEVKTFIGENTWGSPLGR